MDLRRRRDELIVQLDPSYETYRQRTTRQIPVVVLEPAARA
ncbi:MAG: DUF385 domain-containing protein [Deltaproteobacteria bacterium]|nr:MAG: DUF385 domain-containing protein [Deltaproteobacteria bacterium]